MEGDGGDGDGLGDLLSLGSSSRSSRSGLRNEEREGFSGRAGDEANFAALSSLSRDGLSMLAGGSYGGFTLKPPPVGNLSRLPGVGNTASGERTGRGSGGFTGFYGASGVGKSTWPSARAGVGFRAVNEETEGKDDAVASSSRRECSGNVGKPEVPLWTDVENLTPEECWKLALKLGKRWPAWTRTTALPSFHGLVKDRSDKDLDLGRHLGNYGARLGHGTRSEALQLGQEAFKLLTSRALEALAQTPPDRYGRPARTMRAPKLTTQQFCNTRAAARDLPGCTSQSAHSTPATDRQPALSAKPPTTSPRRMAAPATSPAGVSVAPLTIFYDGQVIVCDNVPKDRAHFIMLFAERSSINSNAQAPAPTASCGAPSSIASPHSTPDPVVAPQASVRPQEEFQPCKPSADPVVVPVTSSVPEPPESQLAPPFKGPPEGSSSRQNNIESSKPAEVANVAAPPVPCKVSVTEGNSRQLMQQCLNGSTANRLPNARKNSLARFLDSRKRNRPAASSSEDQPAKKQELGPPSDRLPSDAVGASGDGDGKSPLPLSAQSSIGSKEGITAMYTNDAEMKPK